MQVKASDTLVADMWRTFERQAVHPLAPQEQRDEMRLAFYAGVMSLLIFQREVLGDEEVSEETGVACVEAMYRECLRWIENSRPPSSSPS
jgi:hypothetical protein